MNGPRRGSAARPVLASLALALFITPSAGADLVDYEVSGGTYGVDSEPNIITNFQGASYWYHTNDKSIYLGWFDEIGSYSSYLNGAPPKPSGIVSATYNDAHFEFKLQLGSSSSYTPVASITISGVLNGTIQDQITYDKASGLDYDYFSGGYTGTVTSIQIAPDSPGTNLPAPFDDLINYPERLLVQVSGGDNDPGMPRSSVSLEILPAGTPPATAPEPGGWVLLATALGMIGLGRGLGRRT